MFPEDLTELGLDELNALARRARARIDVLTAQHAAFQAGAGDELTPEQQRAVLAYIKSFWSADIRAAQADLSRRYDEAQP